MNILFLPPARLFSTRAQVALALLSILAIGLLHVPSARAAIECLPLGETPRFEAGQWSTVSSFYEVPVGGVMATSVARANSRVRKTGTNTDQIYVSVAIINVRGTWLGAPVNGYSIPGMAGLALRTRIAPRPNPNNTWVDVRANTNMFPASEIWNTPISDYMYSQDIILEIVRAQETIPNGTHWSLPAQLPISFSINTNINTGATQGSCPALGFTNFLPTAGGPLPLPNTPHQPITCTLNINNGNSQVSFGSIQLTQIATVSPGQPPTDFIKQSFDVHYFCTNTLNTATPTYTLSWHGTPATGKPYALQVIQDNHEKAGVGIVMESESGDPPVVKVLELETGRVAASHAGRTGGNSVKFHAYPIRTDNSAITPGSFKGTATIRINLY